MSVAALNGVWKHSSATDPASLSVLLALADWADQYGYCYPSIPAIAEKARVSERQVIRVVKKFMSRGELEKIAKGHDNEAPGHRPGRTGLQARNHYRLTCVPGESNDTPSRLPKIKAVTGARGSRDSGGAEEVTVASSHIRNEPSEEPSEEPSGGNGAAPLSPAPEQAFAALWNDSTTDPIRPCAQLTAQRRRHIRQRLTERPLTEWVAVFTRVQASAFCRGENERGWVADFAWIIGSADVAVKVLEGKYDGRPGRERSFTASELADAKQVVHANGGCCHEPRCASTAACQAAIIRRWRREHGEGAVA